MVPAALETAETLQTKGISAGVVNARFAKPIDREWLAGIARKTPHLVTIEENAFIGGFGSALEQIFRRNYPTYGVGIQLNLPLRNRVAQADYVRDQLQLRQTQVQRQQLENLARMQVEDAVIVLERTRASYQAAVDSRRYQEESLAAEQEKFAVGLSTTFLVIQYESQVAQARSTEVVARGAYAKARANLDRALGMTLDSNNVSISDAYNGRVSQPPAAPAPAAPRP
jgi:outer membrane protein TolC